MKTLQNPFIDVGYKGGSYFCDRKTETQQLIYYIKNQTNVTLFAFRRLGKTGLIKHVFHQLAKEKNLVCIYLDIFSTTNKAEFINQLATAVYNAFPEKNHIGKKIISAIQSLRPTISFDDLTGVPSISFDAVSASHQQNTLASLFSFIDQQNIKVVFAIDEFQQILSYPEKNMEAILRTHIQQLKNTSFIFCGSNQTMMHEIFNSAKRPFFASCSYLNLACIEQKEYSKFISKLFKRHKKTIENEAVEFICEWTLLHTFYTQNLCKEIFAKSAKEVLVEHVKETAAEVLKLQEGKFYQYRNLLTTSQWKILTAIAKEQHLTQPNAKRFLIKYSLGTPSAVSRAIESLLKKEMILHNAGVEVPYYEVYDKYLMRWLQSKN